MYRLENQILDIYDDVNLKETLREIAPSIPGHLKTAAAPSIEVRNAKPDSAFALRILTKQGSVLAKYPVDTPADAFLSGQYLARNAHKLPTTAAKLASLNVARACARHGVQAPLIVKEAAAVAHKEGLERLGNAYMERMNESLGLPQVWPTMDTLLMKAAAAEVPLGRPEFEDSPYFYAITKTANGRRADARYAMPSPEFVRTAAEYLQKHASAFTPEERHQFAHNVCMRARELGCSDVANNDAIRKYAGLGGYGTGVHTQLELRKQACISEDRRESFNNLMQKMASVKPEDFVKVLSELDKRAGLEKYYGGFLQDPYAATYAGPVEAAIAKQAAGTVDMGNMKKRALVESHFGKEVAELLAKEGAAAIDALPNDAKEILAAIESGEIV